TSTEASATASGSTGAPALSPRGAGVTSRSNSAPDTVGSATGSGATSSSAVGAGGTDSIATSDDATSSQSTTGAPLSPCDSVSACADEPECDYAVEFLQYHACKLDAYVCGDKSGYVTKDGREFPQNQPDWEEWSRDAYHAYLTECHSGTIVNGNSSGDGTGGASSTTGEPVPACECSEGDCCDGCYLLPLGTLCAVEVYDSECNGASLNHLRQKVFCDGESPVCDGATETTQMESHSCDGAPADPPWFGNVCVKDSDGARCECDGYVDS